MYVYNSLLRLAVVFGWLKREFYNWGNTIRNIFLIGQHLSHWLFSVSDFLADLEEGAHDLADDWRELYNWLLHNLGSSNVPAALLQWADDLIAFIQEPDEWISDVIKSMFPGLRNFLHDPVEWLLESLYRYTGLSIDFIDDPIRVIENLIDNAIRDVRSIIQDPTGWLFEMLDNVIPDFWRFVYDARGWVRRHVEDEFPFIISFLQDPDGFIEDKLINFLDGIADRYRDRAIKLFEKVLDAIF